jgi:hypothetical protein
MPLSTAETARGKVRLTQSLSRYLESMQARVAPMELEKETITVPARVPKIAPASSPRIVAPGRFSVTTPT